MQSCVLGLCASCDVFQRGCRERLLSTVDGLLIDIDGVLMIGEEVIPGAPETIAALRARGIPFRFMTNTTIYCRYTLAERCAPVGFPVELDELYTATYVAARYLRDHEARSYFPLLLPDAQLEFTGIDVDEEQPEYVVVGRHGRQLHLFTPQPGLSRLAERRQAGRPAQETPLAHGGRPLSGCRALRHGAWSMPAETNALVVGKPNAAYFQLVLDDLNLPPNRVAMIGDDIEIDVKGAKLMGIQGWLVKTGRFRKEDLARGIWPDRVLESITELNV